MTIYEKIRFLRIKQGLSQQDLADKLGYKSRSAINKIELGLRDVSYSKIIDFAHALDVSPLYFLDQFADAYSLINVDPKNYNNLLSSINGLTNEQIKQVITYVNKLKSKN